MSHRTLSWVLTLTAFLLFALACTIGRKVSKGEPDRTTELRMQKDPAANKKTTSKQRSPSARELARCGMEDFYRKNPTLRGHMPPVLESAVRVKLVDHLSSQLETSRDMSPAVLHCLGQQRREANALADAEQ